MNRKNIYMIQPNYLYGNSAHLPYAAGAVAAYVFSDPVIRENCELKKIQFLREDPDTCVAQAEEPFLIGFSSYVWNFEYNKILAEKFKRAYPGCIIVFGGHHVAPGGELLDRFAYMDILVHGEGEEPLRQILLALLGKGNLHEIPNISFREGGKAFNTPYKEYSSCDYPSPYLEGYFDDIVSGHPELSFELMFETNRGCAYSCSYCDWGSLRAKIRRFPLQRVYDEFEWACKRKIEFFGCADANFGILARDEEIIDRLIELKNTTGYPKKFQTSYAKNNSQRIYNIGKKLHDSDMNKGVTLAFQTLCPEASANVGRTNVSLQHYKKLMRLYNAANIPTYTELILGLPGETYRSYADGLNMLMEAGQHHAIYVHNCEWLPCSAMGSRAYIERFGIGISKIPLNQPHMALSKDSGEIPEYSQIVTKTASMDHDMWIETNMLSYTVQCFHHMNLLQFFAIALHDEKKVAYIDFYERLLAYIDHHAASVCGRVFADIRRRLREVVEGRGGLLCYDSEFGEISWPFVEYAFLKIVREIDTFYDEIADFLRAFGLPDDLFDSLLLYQRNIIKRPNRKTAEFDLAYNLHDYFAAKFKGESAAPVRQRITLKIADSDIMTDWASYARYVVWYGRKESKNICSGFVTAKDGGNA